MISIIEDLVCHDRANYVEIDRYFMKQKLIKGSFKNNKTPTKIVIAYILIKALVLSQLDNLTFKLGVINIYIPSLREGVKISLDMGLYNDLSSSNLFVPFINYMMIVFSVICVLWFFSVLFVLITFLILGLITDFFLSYKYLSLLELDIMNMIQVFSLFLFYLLFLILTFSFENHDHLSNILLLHVWLVPPLNCLIVGSYIFLGHFVPAKMMWLADQSSIH